MIGIVYIYLLLPLCICLDAMLCNRLDENKDSFDPFVAGQKNE